MRFLSQAFASASLQGTRCAVEQFLTARRLLLREPGPDPFSPLLDRYRRHLSDVRGLASATVEQHIATAKSLLAQALPADAGTSSIDRPNGRHRPNPRPKSSNIRSTCRRRDSTGLSALAPAQRAGAQRLCAVALFANSLRCNGASAAEGRPSVARLKWWSSVLRGSTAL